MTVGIVFNVTSDKTINLIFCAVGHKEYGLFFPFLDCALITRFLYKFLLKNDYNI